MVALAVAGSMVVFYAPVDSVMGLPQKLIYLHLPAAIASFVTAMVVFVASLGYLWTRKPIWNQVARRAGIATVVCSLAVLLTGMIWAHHTWDLWWTWSPRLTFTLVLFVLYAGYLAMQYLPSAASGRWETRCAVYGCVAFLDVPLVYVSIRLLPDIHPTSLPLTGEMRQTLLPCFVLAGLVCLDLIAGPALGWMQEKTGHALDADDRGPQRGHHPLT